MQVVERGNRDADRCTAGDWSLPADDFTAFVQHHNASGESFDVRAALGQKSTVAIGVTVVRSVADALNEHGRRFVQHHDGG